MRGLYLGLVGCFSAEILGCGSPDVYLNPPCFDSPWFSEAEPCEGRGPRCPGGCIPVARGKWEGPMAVWMGPTAEAPECPTGIDGASIEEWHGYAGRNPPIQCGACSCGPSTGSCRLPISFTAHAAPLCAASATATTFNAPYMWNGSCTDANPILVNATCPPGNTLCVQSISIAPVAVHADAKCAPSVEPPALVTEAEPDPADPLWETKAVACNGDGQSNCLGGLRCVNTAPVNGWRQCVWGYGLHECVDSTTDGAGGNDTGAGGNDTGAGGAEAGPTGFDPPAWYTERFVFYTTTEDRRTCSPCTCGTPQRDSCMSQISLYSNPGCSGVPFWSQGVSDGGCVVGTIPAGTALMSKEATEPMYTPGTCTPFGGNPIGSVVGSAPVTVCCLPLP